MNQVKQNGADIEVSGALTRDVVEDVRLELLTATSGRRKKFQLNLASVTDIDSTGVQLLASLLKSFPASRLVEPSEVVVAYWERIGAAMYFREAMD